MPTKKLPCISCSIINVYKEFQIIIPLVWIIHICGINIRDKDLEKQKIKESCKLQIMYVQNCRPTVGNFKSKVIFIKIWFNVLNVFVDLLKRLLMCRFGLILDWHVSSNDFINL